MARFALRVAHAAQISGLHRRRRAQSRAGHRRELVDALLLRTLPVRDPASLAVVHLDTKPWGWIGYSDGSYSEFTFPLWQEIEKRQQSFSSIAAWGDTQLNLAHGGEVDNAQAIWVSGGFFEVLGIRPFLGRLISPSDDPESVQAGCAGAVDLSYAFWRRRYGGDRSVVGKTLTLEGHPFPIVGVTPPSFYGVSVGVGSRFDVAVPVCAEPLIARQYSYITSPLSRENWWLAILGRLKPGWTLARATAQLESIAPAALHATTPPQYDSVGVKHYLAYKLEARSAAKGFSYWRATPGPFYRWDRARGWARPGAGGQLRIELELLGSGPARSADSRAHARDSRRRRLRCELPRRSPGVGRRRHGRPEVRMTRGFFKTTNDENSREMEVVLRLRHVDAGRPTLARRHSRQPTGKGRCARATAPGRVVPSPRDRRPIRGER